MNSEKIVEDKDLKWIDGKVALEVEPFLDCLRTDPAVYSKFARAYSSFSKRVQRAATITLKLTHDASKVHSNLYKTFSYLGFIESYGNTIVDLLVFLCVATGIDFHIECQHTTPRIKHAETIDDLENERVPLTTKINFLRDNGLIVFSSLIDTELRNTIAHMKFEIKGDEVFVKGKQLTDAKLTNTIRKTIEALLAVYNSISKAMEEKHRSEKSN
jgi:hypothetical protein